MLYNPPTGGAANDPYVGKNVAAGTQGSKVPPAAAEFPQREIVAVITASGQAPTNNDLTQMLRAVRSGALEYYVDSGAANAPAIAPAPAHTSLTDGLHVRVRMKSAPTGPSNLAVNSFLAPVQTAGAKPLAGGEWAANDVVDLVYNASRNAFQIVSGAGAIATSALWHVGTDSSNTAAKIVATVTPIVSARVAKLAYLIFPANACAGATTIDVGFGPQPLTRSDAAPLQALDYSAGQPLVIIDDGTQFRIETAVASQITASTSTYISNNYAKGSLIATRVFSTPGSSPYVPTPGTNRVNVTVQGGGGSGGPIAASASGQFFAAGGGGCGGNAVSNILSGFSGLTITVGGGSTAPGVSGGTSSFGSLLSATGGGSPATGSASAIAQVQTGGAGGVGSGGNVSNGGGASGGLGIAEAPGNLVSGFGAGSQFGAGGNSAFTSNSPGQSAASYGAGGGGACTIGNSGALAGGNGAGGVVIIAEYA